MTSDGVPLSFGRLSRIFYGAFLLAAVYWFGVCRLLGVPGGQGAFWFAAVTMTAAHVYYYVLQAFASEGGRSRLDLAINVAQLGAGMALAAAYLGAKIPLRTALWLVAGVAFLHPVITDWPHVRRFFRTKVADYVPPVCLPVDATAGVFVLIALLA